MLSVIIPTYNESDVVFECLESLAKQSYKDFEVIVVDDGSTDNTWDLLSKLEKDNPLEKRNLRLEILKQQHEGPGAARNLGVSKAKGEILVFIDADMTFDSNFLKSLVKPIMAGRTKGTFSKYEFVSNWENVWARCWNINQNWEPKSRHPKNYSDKQKVFRAILKEEFDRVGGFTPGGYTDDYSLSEKLGYMADSAPSANFYHKNPASLTEVFTHARWVGKRSYKLGAVGYVIALIRASFPVSIILGILKAVMKKRPAFLVFKLVYDFGIVMGILEMLLTGKKIK